MVTDTSLLSYINLVETGELGLRQNIVYDAIKSNPDLTDSELTKVLGFNDPNKVRPRRKELCSAGLILCSGKRKCSITKRLCMTWR